MITIIWERRNKPKPKYHHAYTKAADKDHRKRRTAFVVQTSQTFDQGTVHRKGQEGNIIISPLHLEDATLQTASTFVKDMKMYLEGLSLTTRNEPMSTIRIIGEIDSSSPCDG